MNPAPLTVPSANSILDGVVIGAPTPADFVGRYAAPDILRMNALPPALVRIIPATRVDAEALAPAVEPTEPSPGRSLPQPDPGAPDGGLEPGFARPKSLSVAMSLNSECRQGGGKLYEVYLVCRRRSPLAVIKRQRAEQSAGIINDRHRPAGPEAVRQRDRRIFGPKVGLLNILDNDHLATGRSGSTRALRDADRHGIDRARVRIWKARSRAGSQQPARRVDEQHRAVQTVRPGLDVRRESVEQHIEGRGRAEQSEQSDLRAHRIPLRGRSRCAAHNGIDGGGPVLMLGCRRHAVSVRRQDHHRARDVAVVYAAGSSKASGVCAGDPRAPRSGSPWPCIRPRTGREKPAGLRERAISINSP